ncbi:MAG: phage tail protein [Ramlibacter sp.]|nr:phage tail protein [Ramlibacter sp.]
MALEEYVGAVVLEIDGREIEITSLDVKDMTGRKPVKTMNRTGRLKGFTRGIGQFDIKATAVVPVNGSMPDWANIEGAKITQEPLAGGQRVSYLDCFTVDVGEQYSVDNEARVDINMHALRKVQE